MSYEALYIITKQRLREQPTVSFDCALGVFLFFLLYFGCCFLVFFPLPWGTLGREGGCALGGQLCAALTGCVRPDPS